MVTDCLDASLLTRKLFVACVGTDQAGEGGGGAILVFKAFCEIVQRKLPKFSQHQPTTVVQCCY